MKLKSLLLGSAAALVAVSGARAADAIIAEPEPVEYVRVCDAYGAGFFYIPGTETCLQIGGYVRYQIDIDADGWTKNTRGQLTVDARSETDYGTLRGYIAFQGNSNGTALLTSGGSSVINAVYLDSAFIELGGLHIGYSDNAFDGDIGGEVDSLGGAKTDRIAYTFASGGFDATISLDDDGNGDFTPNVSANAGFTAGPAAVRLFAAYDNNADAFAIKARVTASVSEGGTLGVAAVYGDAATYVWSDSEWAIAASYGQKVSDTIAISVGAQYWQDVAWVAGRDKWAIGANIDWTPVAGFLARASITHSDDDLTGESTGGYIRFQRSF